MQILRSALLALALAACSGGEPPQINGLSDQIATVGGELIVRIDGSDPDGDDLTYGVHTEVSLQGTANLSQDPSGMGVFRWTPLADDIGAHAFDFTASDGSKTTTVSITIEVRSAVGEVPIFREPLGAGRTANPAICMIVDIVIEDRDTAQVTIAEEAPTIPGAQLVAIDGTSATWEWCPTPAQVAAQDRYTLVLSADDGDNPKTIKNYVIVLNSTTPRLVINEVDYDQVGTDTAEYIELFNPSSAPASLAGLRVVLVNGATNTAYDTIDLSSAGTLAGGQYLVITGSQVAVPAGALSIDPVWSQDEIQNGAPDGLALIDSVTHTLLDALSYEGSINAATITDFPASVSLVEGAALGAAVADSSTAVRTLCRMPNGSDTNDAATDWVACGSVTPGAENAP
ncbi:MAG: lamin tail domain-containing protein [Deltaproteobacteria bacterium]|nr:lamin tail domain-containing protein [Deltaproteobacteria bacterium]